MKFLPPRLNKRIKLKNKKEKIDLNKEVNSIKTLFPKNKGEMIIIIKIYLER